MKPINLTKGQEILNRGRPAKPLPASVENKFKTVLHELPAVVESHLPQVFVPGIDVQARQVLVVVLRELPEKVLPQLQATISDSFPPDFYIDVWPLAESDTILKDIRAATMRIK
jgi:hypothetical protein